ncbi:hypothetical protein [Chitinophaga sp. Ak27]|uniref:hypothetical protein n=1 Tax=Chitinophaga sp. Ak27 TaxID=2726116 RepID=UPI00145CEBB9|nr:hypothetical protein [Chitinophaga sp. Ak27]NLU90758.1 hypothetical protein [Chitinophaga sp. Ak27]
MKKNFPIATLISARQELEASQRTLKSDKAAWTAVRKTLNDATRKVLDEQVNLLFARDICAYFWSAQKPDLDQVMMSLRQLYQQGASARSLNNYELGEFNLAMVVKSMMDIEDRQVLALTLELVQLTIIADADVYSQKAYMGNGGSVCLELACVGLGWGLREGDTCATTQEQYMACYQVFLWLIEKPEVMAAKYHNLDPFALFFGLHATGYGNYEVVAPIHDKVTCTMISLGFLPFSTSYPESEWSDMGSVSSFLGRTKDEKWINLLFPNEHPLLMRYLQAWEKAMIPAPLNILLNNFSASNTGRKIFKASFSPGPHWLIAGMIRHIPGMLFSLVTRNEKQLLAPFLKNYKRQLSILQNEKGQSLLQYAQHTRGVKADTIQLLREANIPFPAYGQ